MDFFSERNFSIRTAFILLAAIFGTELAAMLLLYVFDWSSPLAEALVDSCVVVIFMLPIIYFVVVRPLSRRIVRQYDTEQKLFYSEERFAAIADATPDMIFLFNRSGCVLYCNPATENLLGFPMAQVTGKHASRFIHPEDWDSVDRALHALLAGSPSQSMSLRLLKKDGTGCTVEACGFAMGEGRKRIIGTILRDLSQRQAAQQETEEYRHLLEKLLSERTDHLEKMLDFSTNLASTTEAGVLMRKCTQHTRDLLGLDFSTLMILSEDKNSLVIRDTLGFPDNVIDSFTLLRGQGLATWVADQQRPATVIDFSTESRFEVPLLVTQHNITSAICVPMMIANEVFGVLIGHTKARREFEEWEISLYQNFANQAAVALDNASHLQNLKVSEKKFRSFFENTSDPLFIYSIDGPILEVNRAACERMGFTRSEFLRMTPAEIVAPDQVAMVSARIEIVKNAKQAIFESAHKTKNGQIIPIELNCRLIEYDGKPAIIGVARDIRERQRSEAALRESEERYRDLFENASDLIQIVKPDGRFLYVNRAWRETLGYSQEEVRLLSIFDVIGGHDGDDSCQATFGRVLTEGKVDHIETSFVTKDGRVIQVEGAATCRYEKGQPESTRCIFRDVTEKRQLEIERQKTEKLESIGVLAGGIAHDFNNLLTAIIGNIALAKIQLSKDDPVYGRLAECEKASHRAKTLTQQLLTFSKGGAPITSAATVSELIRDSASFMLAGSKTTCFYELPADLWRVQIDAGQISQVIQNLVKNADQAMPGGGRIHIKAQNVSIGPKENLQLALKPGKYVKLCVSDSGPGIPQNKLTQIFDPYFTTKTGGSGLGLAIAFSIMKRHNGMITADSKEGEGANFCLYLPEEEKKGSVKALETKRAEKRAHGRVLVMDDEDLVCQVARGMLEHFGYEVESTADGDAAVAAYKKAREDGRPFDLVIMDLTVPGGMGGEAAIKELLAIDPKAKGVVSSGYANDSIMANFRDYGFQAVVPKPYKMAELADVVAGLLVK